MENKGEKKKNHNKKKTKCYITSTDNNFLKATNVSKSIQVKGLEEGIHEEVIGSSFLPET